MTPALVLYVVFLERRREALLSCLPPIKQFQKGSYYIVQAGWRGAKLLLIPAVLLEFSHLRSLSLSLTHAVFPPPPRSRTPIFTLRAGSEEEEVVDKVSRLLMSGMDNLNEPSRYEGRTTLKTRVLLCLNERERRRRRRHKNLLYYNTLYNNT